MRLTIDLINSSLSYINPIKERELDLRGHNIPLLESLAAPPILQSSSLDLTDNALTSLSNLPLLPRLTSLYCARNRLVTLPSGLGRCIPNLSALTVAENDITDLPDVCGIKDLSALKHFVCCPPGIDGNAVGKKDDYRLWIVWLCPSIRYLDYVKVKDSERTRAKEVFGKCWEDMSDYAKEVLKQGTGKRVLGLDTDGEQPARKRVKLQLSDEEKTKIQNMIRNATSLKEIERLEKMITEGRIPT